MGPGSVDQHQVTELLNYRRYNKHSGVVVDRGKLDFRESLGHHNYGEPWADFFDFVAYLN